ncbi:MAG: trigger factor [Deltaproteobacteria bacterium]|nr:trigger factor [Deltaproteobacteria bacterium]
MQVRIEDVSPVEKKMFVEIPWETVSQKLGNAYRELGKGVALKGFRKGKVPRPVLEQVYGSRVNAEVAYELVRESFFRANQEHNLAAVAEPRVEEAAPIKKGQPFTFKAIIEVRGEVIPQEYTELPIERRRLDIPETAVEEAIAQLRREHTELKPIEGREITALGDIVGLSVTGTIGEHAINQPQFAVDLDDPEREPLPGLREALTGIPLDTKDKPLEITVPEDHKDDSIKGRKASLVVTILEVRAKDVPALDDEFAKDTGKADTLDGLRGALRKELEEKEQATIDREAREAVLRELIKKNQIPVASSLVERAVEMQYQRLRQMLGMKPERGNNALAGLTDDLRDKMRPAGADEVRGQLLLEAIADKENIAVTDEELGKHVETTAKARNMPAAKLKAEWQRDGRLDNVTYSLRQDKVLGFLVGKATITEVEKLTQQGTPLPEGGPESEHNDAGPEGHVHGPDCDHG